MRYPAAALVAALLTGCVVGETEPQDAATPLAPTFAPVETPSASPAPPATEPPDAQPGASAMPGPTPPSMDGGTSEAPDAANEPAPVPSAGPTSAAAPVTLSASITDPRGDTTPSLEREPDWSDLVGAALERTGDDFTLWVDLDGGAPDSSGSADHTMNVASFYDLTGDGRVDVEVWVNLADGGWDSALYDNRDRSAAFSTDDPIEVRVEDERLRVDFPASVLDGSSAFRWAIASEWGRYEQLGTALAVRDDAPDDDRPAAFPG